MSICIFFTSASDLKIEELSNNADSLEEFLEEADVFDVEKAWHALHYLFTGSTWKGEEPLCYLVYKGRIIGTKWGSDVRAIGKEQLAAFESALQSIDQEELLKRFDGKAMAKAEIYPEVLWERDDQDGRDYLCHYLDLLKSFLAEAKDRQEGMLIWVG